MPAERPLLYTYRRCPYAMRARMALLQAGLPFHAHEIVLKSKPAALLQASSKGTVPVLVLPDGQVIDQSWDIVRWALTHPLADPAASQWWTLADTDENQRLLYNNDTTFKHHLDRYKYPERFSDIPPQDRALAQQAHRAQAVQQLEVLEARLRASPNLGGSVPCATDMGIFPFVRQFAAVDPPWFQALPLPEVQRWLAHWLASALFGRCMCKLPADQVVPFDA
jgi:glutathione S-transferase